MGRENFACVFDVGGRYSIEFKDYGPGWFLDVAFLFSDPHGLGHSWDASSTTMSSSESPVGNPKIIFRGSISALVREHLVSIAPMLSSWSSESLVGVSGGSTNRSPPAPTRGLAFGRFASRSVRTAFLSLRVSCLNVLLSPGKVSITGSRGGVAE